ncbi:MAG: LPS export ABC transporter permease LptG [Cyanobacteria bacterium]|nr:LPS export ABC transporter permease LptG [Cyanobacteriota bacterium]
MMTKLLDRYIAKSIFLSIGLVTLVLAGLQIFILFVNQLDVLGKAEFGIVQAGLFVLLEVPYQVYLFFPVASMLGCLIGLGIMANNRELIVMRAAGMSIAQITYSVLKAAMLLILLVTLMGETIIPKLSHFANDMRMQALSGGQALRTAKGVWLRYQNDFIAIGTISKDNLENVYQFRFNEQHQLSLARTINRITFIDGSWQAYGISETLLSNQKTIARHIWTMPWDVVIKPSVLSFTSREPDEMSLHELRQYLRMQKKNRQTELIYQQAYWQRIFQPFTTMVMMILAIPFIFGPLRSSTMGSKLLVGATVGFGFHIVNRFFGPFSQVFQLPPIMSALGPTLLFAIIAVYLMKRVR